MTPPTPLQNSYASFEGEQESYEVECRGWSAKERTLMARTKPFLERSHSAKVQVEELEDLLGPDAVGVDFRRILKEARDQRGRKIFETFSSDDLSFLVAEWSRCDKYKRATWRQDSSVSASDGWRREDHEQLIVSWSPIEKKVDGCSGRLFGELRPSEHSEALNEKRQQYFPALRHIREAEPLCGKQKTMAGESKEKLCTARMWAKRVA